MFAYIKLEYLQVNTVMNHSITQGVNAITAAQEMKLVDLLDV